MAITTRTAKGSQLTIAEGDANITELNAGALVIVRTTFTEGGNYTVPSGTGHVVNLAASQIYNCTLTFPASPIIGQTLIISTKTSLVRVMALAGNGNSITGPTSIFLGIAGSVSYQYNATDGWVLTRRDTGYSNSASVDIVGMLDNSNGGWRWSMAGSVDYYLGPAYSWIQSTNAGIGGRPSLNRFWSQSTPDLTDTSPDYFRNSWNGFQASMNNSSIPFGVGATNDAPLSFVLACTPNAVSFNNGVISGAPGGTYCFGWSVAPFIFGGQTLGEFARFDPAGNFITAKALADASVVRNTGTVGFTVGDNISTVILAGSGTVPVTFPANPVNGQLLRLTLETAYTAVTVLGNGKTVITGLTIGMTAGSFATWRYHLANTTWHRVG